MHLPRIPLPRPCIASQYFVNKKKYFVRMQITASTGAKNKYHAGVPTLFMILLCTCFSAQSTGAEQGCVAYMSTVRVHNAILAFMYPAIDFFLPLTSTAF
jgi:hypothetical protein